MNRGLRGIAGQWLFYWLQLVDQCADYQLEPVHYVCHYVCRSENGTPLAM